MTWDTLTQAERQALYEAVQIELEAARDGIEDDPENEVNRDYAEKLDSARHKLWPEEGAAVHALSQERDWVVSVVEYGGHEASGGVHGPYTQEEALDKLRELAGDPEAGAEGRFGGFDWSDESTQILVSQLDR